MTWALNWWRPAIKPPVIINVIGDYKVKYLKPEKVLVKYIENKNIKIKLKCK